MKTNQTERLIVRKSGNFYTSAAIQPQMNREKSEYEARSYFIYSGNEQKDVTSLTMSNKWGTGVSVELLKIGAKRNTSLSIALGLDEISIMMDYLQSIKDKIGNYTGEIIKSI